MITATQARMARAALRLTVRDVAEKAGLDKNTVSNFEMTGSAHTSTAQSLRDFYEARGCRFIDGGVAHE